jgi:hypothetical protein
MNSKKNIITGHHPKYFYIFQVAIFFWIYSGHFVIMLTLYDIYALKTDFSSMVAGVINPAKRPDTMENQRPPAELGV